MKIQFLLVVIMVLAFTVCPGAKAASKEEQATAKMFLSSDELKSLHTGKIIVWERIRDGQTGRSYHHDDGTLSNVGAGRWEVRDKGIKCNIFGNKEYCAQFKKKGDKYIGMDLTGEEIFEFIITNTLNNEVVSINPSNGDIFTSDEVDRMFSGNSAEWSFLNENKKGITEYLENGSIAIPVGTWRIAPDGLKCVTLKSKNREFCGKAFKEGSSYYYTSQDGSQTTESFTVEE